MNKIVSFIKNSRLKLNAIIIFSWFLKITFISSLISGFIIFIFRFFRLFNMNIYNWIILAITGGFVGIIIGWSRRINIISASKWIDDYLKKNDILTAALICTQRKNSNIFDKLIIEKAGKILEKKIKIKWPLKDIFKRLMFAAASSLFFIYILGFWKPAYDRRQFTDLNSKTDIDSENREDEENNKDWHFDKEQTPEDLTRLLFPENQELSELAEEAMARGDTQMLYELFDKEISKLDEMIKKAKTQEEIDEIRKKQEQQKEAMQLIKNNENKEKENESENQENEGESMLSNNENSESENQSEENNRQNDQEEDDKSKEAGIDSTEKGDGSVSGNQQSDTGVSDQKKRRDNIGGENTKEKLLLTQKKDSLEFEFLLPEKDSRIPLKDVIINSRRSAESAVIRKGVPIEYEDFVRSYFMSLLQEMKKNLSNEEDKK